MVCSYDPSSISSCMLGYCCLQLLLLSTDNLVHKFSFFQEQECWHSINCPLLSNSLQFININLEEGDIWQLFSNLCQNWGNETARATPRSSEINYNQFLGSISLLEVFLPSLHSVNSDHVSLFCCHFFLSSYKLRFCFQMSIFFA
uniref:Uncharacterized protein n=1 Tax=Medicago truncatula TaxID=3880 RepID=B7FN70_MEDTR|nr:unknown [Medicago truncatula]AFK37993.1 unknown [Medicago truncatula]